jgi:hypothetical protein
MGCRGAPGQLSLEAEPTCQRSYVVGTDSSSIKHAIAGLATHDDRRLLALHNVCAAVGPCPCC